MPGSIRVGGAWKALTVYERISGAWKEIAVSNRISGAWKALTTIGGGGGTPCSIGGSLSASGSGSSITGPSRPVTVPSGNSGKLLFRNIVSPPDGVLSFSVAGRSYTEVGEESTITWTDNQSITGKAQALIATESISVDIYDFDTDTLIQTATFTKT